MPQRRFINPDIYTYQQSLRSTLVTTRFNHQTWAENQAYLANTPFQCIYASITPLAQSVAERSPVFVLEMNNDTNTILGIGLVLNVPIINKYNIYQTDTKHNQYAYVGKHRIERTTMTPEAEEIMQVLDQLCFRGKRHLKRLVGIKQFPLDMLYNCKVHAGIDLVKYIAHLFQQKTTPT